jgi:hypothetical protein
MCERPLAGAAGEGESGASASNRDQGLHFPIVTLPGIPVLRYALHSVLQFIVLDFFGERDPVVLLVVGHERQKIVFEEYFSRSARSFTIRPFL